ncbi:mCpol domain-containing protein [Kordia sp.]|uniref:mCpol domain-containing protein n=1 Tax=Kordia sp. TaxID=1965332 RepID=UPI003B5C57E5
MEENIYIRLDADNIGDNIELSLLKNDYITAQKIHNKVQTNINNILNVLKSKNDIEILLIGCDDILFSINTSNYDFNFIKNIAKNFEKNSGFTLSIGIGNTVSSALKNLRIAKLSGKNNIIITLKK